MFPQFCSWLLFCVVFYKNHPSSFFLCFQEKILLLAFTVLCFWNFWMPADYLYSAFYCFTYFISLSLIPRLICCGVALTAPDLALLDSVTNGVALKLYLCLALLETVRIYRRSNFTLPCMLCLSYFARSQRFCSGVAWVVWHWLRQLLLSLIL